MLFYLFVFFCCVLFAGMADVTRKGYGVFFVFCIVFLLSLVGGVRDIGIGTDTMVYSENYFYEAKHLSSFQELAETHRDKGYLFLNLIGVKVSEHLWMAQFTIQFFTHGLILFAAWYLRKHLYLKMSLFTLAYCCIFYNQTYNFMRQYCALALLFLGLYYVISGRWKCYMGCQVGAFFFHSTSLLFVFVPILYYTCMINKGGRWRYWLIGASLLAVFAVTASFYEALALLNAVDIVSDVHADRYGMGDVYGAREGMRKSLVLIIGVVLYFIYKAYKRKLINFDFTVLLLSVHLFFIALYLLSFYSVYLYRLSLYFYLPVILFTTFIVSSKKVLSLERVGWICLLLLDWYIYVVRHAGAESFPYHSKILGI